MTNHDLLLFTLGSLSGFLLTAFVFACWYSQKREEFISLIEKTKRDSWAGGYDAAHKNITTRLTVTKQ